MKAEKNAKKKNAKKRLISRIMVLALALVAVLSSITFFPVETKAGNSTLTIQSRYFGYPAITKAVIGIDELCSIGGGYSATYTTTTNGMGSGFLSYGQGTGATLYNILTYSGVNPELASRFNFLASDEHNSNTEYTAGSILWSQRFYFPDLSKYFARNTGISDPDEILSPDEIANSILWVNAQQVETMIAAYEGFGRVDDYSEFNGWTQTADKSFRLMFGQTSPSEKNASDFIYGIHTIIVTYDGKPEISANDVKFKIGENQQLEVSVDSYESELSQMIMDGLKYQSTDNSVVTVDANGKLTAVGKGEAEIIISYDNQEAGTEPVHNEKRVKIVVGDQDSGSGGAGDGDGDGDKKGDGDGDGGNGDEKGNGSGDGDDSGDKKGNSSSDNTDKSNKNNASESTVSDKPNSVKTKTDSEEETKMYVAKASDTDSSNVKGKTISVRKIVKNDSSSDSSQSENAEGASGSAAGGSAALALSPAKNIAGAIAGGVAVLLFALGIVLSYVKYRREF